MGLAIVGLGALDVFGGTLTIGALVAFNMLAGRVSGPLVQIVAMIHEYQEVALSVEMLGEVMNREPERGRAEVCTPSLAGKIEFEDVTFRYGADGAPALDNISFSVPAGTMFGVVGRSGSGKTTLTRLIQGLYSCSRASSASTAMMPRARPRASAPEHRRRAAGQFPVPAARCVRT